MTTSCIVLAIFLAYYMINHQYMNKFASRYHARFLNHNGDCYYFFWILLFSAAFFFTRYGHKFEELGVPAVKFDPIVPKGQEIYSYYGISNPQEKKELKALELASKNDILMSSFKFADISKILPYSDPACPPDGLCSDTLQTLLYLSISQDTETQNKPVSAFKLQFTEDTSEQEISQTKQLVLKNSSNSEITLEGSI